MCLSVSSVLGNVPLCINLPRDRNGPIRANPAALFCFSPDCKYFLMMPKNLCDLKNTAMLHRKYYLISSKSELINDPIRARPASLFCFSPDCKYISLWCQKNLCDLKDDLKVLHRKNYLISSKSELIYGPIKTKSADCKYILHILFLSHKYSLSHSQNVYFCPMKYQNKSKWPPGGKRVHALKGKDIQKGKWDFLVNYGLVETPQPSKVQMFGNKPKSFGFQYSSNIFIILRLRPKKTLSF